MGTFPFIKDTETIITMSTTWWILISIFGWPILIIISVAVAIVYFTKKSDKKKRRNKRYTPLGISNSEKSYRKSRKKQVITSLNKAKQKPRT